MKKIRDFIYSLFVKNFLPRHKFGVGEYIKDLNETKYRVEALYYDTNLQPILIAIDKDDNLRSFPDKHLERTNEDHF